MRTASNLGAFASRVPGAAIAFLWFMFAGIPPLLTAQQADQPYSYPAPPNGATGSPYAQPSPQSNYAQPQYQQPQYQQPQYGYAQPQVQQPPDQQPQYQQPQMPVQPSPQESYGAPYPGQQLAQPPVPSQALSADQLEQLLAPIALYPD